MITLSHQTLNSDEKFLQLAKTSLQNLLKRKEIGFTQICDRTHLWIQCRERAKEIRGSKIVILGIGGSSLGGIALTQALQIENVEFFENVDPLDFWYRLRKLGDLSKVHWLIISKTGGTVETLTQANFVAQKLEELKTDFFSRCTVVTEIKDSPLSLWAKAHQIPVLEVPIDVGGRFSVLSPVGMLGAAASGVDIENIRQGAKWALDQHQLVAELVAQSLMSFERQEWVTVFWPYSNALRAFGWWSQQLWAESLAKRKNRKGLDAPRVSTPLPLLGANDQHSVLQQVMEGARDKFVMFVSVDSMRNAGPSLKKSLFESEKHLVGKTMGVLLDAEMKATRQALQNENVHSLTLSILDLNEKSMGAFFMLMELVVAALGEALEIDAFDQPGVELGKRLAKQILSN